MSEAQHTSLPLRSTQGTRKRSLTCNQTTQKLNLCLLLYKRKKPKLIRFKLVPTKPDTQDVKHAAAAAQRTTTTSWTPNFERRQSWSAQDRKHELQMAAVDDVGTGPGFTEQSC